MAALAFPRKKRRKLSTPQGSPPSVLLVVSSLSAGGAERVISELANAWADRDWRIGVLTISGRGSDHYRLHPDVARIALDLLWDSRSLGQSIAANVRRSRAIRQAVRGFGPDVVLSFIDQTNVRVLAALLGSRIPVVVSERSIPGRHRIGRVWELARRLLYPLADRVVVQTESVAAWARGFLPARKVEVIPNFVRALPAVAGFGQRDPDAVLAVGRLGVEKGFDLLLNGFAASGLMAQGARLTILGEGPERARLEGLARELGIAEAVALPGIVPNPECWMARCALFVLPSRYEGFPNALIEAMAVGSAVVAADCPSGPRELVRDGENGLLVAPEDTDALAGALVRLMNDAALRRRLGDRAAEVRQRYAREAILDRWQGVMLNCIAGK
jgi:glycosyltransferase involved in cell wall biosynthesis